MNKNNQNELYKYLNVFQRRDDRLQKKCKIEQMSQNELMLLVEKSMNTFKKEHKLLTF